MIDQDRMDAENAIHADLTTITTLWPELLEPCGSGMGQRVKSSRTPPAPVSVHALDVRRDTLTCLAFWAKVVHDERELTSHHDLADLYDVVGLLDRHVGWLLDREDGFEDDAAHWARKVRETARPERQERVRVGPCPVTLAKDGEQVVCGTVVWAYPERPDIRCTGCGYEDTLDWWRAKVAGAREQYVTARDLVDALYLDARVDVTTTTVRVWAHRGYVERHGKDDRGRTLYDWAQVVADVTHKRWAA